MSEPVIPAILLAALIQVESSGNPRAYNRAEDAVGILQIRRIFVDDLNRIYGPPFYTYEDRWDSDKSKEMARKYLRHYGTQRRLGRKPTNEDFARIINGGPNGWKKQSTEKYWVKVEKKLIQLGGK
jgi:hypothetical protein